MTRRVMFALWLTTVLLMACSENCEGSGTPLLGGVMSQQSPEEVKRALGSPERWARVETAKNPYAGRSSYALLLIDVGSITDLGVVGTATLKFLNDRLYSISFTPKTFDPYLQAVKGLRDAHLDDDGIFHLPQHTGIEIGGAPGEDLSFEWYDECLRNEANL